MNTKQLGILALLVAAFCWGPAPVFTKLALVEVPAFAFAFLGRIIALVILAIVFIPRGYLKIHKQDIPMMVAASITGSVLNVGFFIFGIQLTSAMDAQAIFSAGPIVNTALAYFFLKEKIKPIQTMGVLIGFTGAVVISTRTFFETGTLRTGDLLGNFLIFMASLSWVLYILISKKLSKTYRPQTITLYSFLISSAVFAPLAFYTNFNSTEWISELSMNGIFGLFYVGVFASVIAFLAYQTGIKLTSAFAAGVVLYIQPIITTVVAAAVLKEKITPPFVVGAILIIFGYLIATQYEMVKGHVSRRISQR